MYPQAAEQAPPVSRGRAVAARTALAACCLIGGVVAVQQARALQTATPTAAQRQAAERTAVADRWRSWPAGRIFPLTLRYGTSVATTEVATRAGIAPADACKAALSPAAYAAASRPGCVAALRASYVDEPQGVVYTIGVLAFARQRQAAAFAGQLARAGGSVAGLRTLALAGTATARFTDAARQLGSVHEAGPFVVLSVAGYANGLPLARAGQRRPSVFAAASQLAAEVARRLREPAVVDCASRQWSC